MTSLVEALNSFMHSHAREERMVEHGQAQVGKRHEDLRAYD